MRRENVGGGADLQATACLWCLPRHSPALSTLSAGAEPGARSNQSLQSAVQKVPRRGAADRERWEKACNKLNNFLSDLAFSLRSRSHSGEVGLAASETTSGTLRRMVVRGLSEGVGGAVSGASW